ncbi:MAG: class IV adenylate cyclase [candidate division KSB1 bacterium]|nr:class IV adenylate cyclase [candidate division KSB1 bacterium]
MARNIEIKARISDFDYCMKKAESLADAEPEIIIQDDTFFKCENGRLKLRILSKDNGVLIFYNRPDITGPKPSEYHITSTHEPDRLLYILERSYGSCGKVKKTRRLYLIGRTRIHLDQVENLGEFLEFEVVLKENENMTEGKTKANELIKAFNISAKDLISSAYVDMIKENRL